MCGCVITTMAMNEISKSREGGYDSIDLMKLILSLLVVTLHITAFQRELPWVIAISRIAVPLFFITSSYLFFERLSEKPNDREWREKRLRRFCVRGIRLYFNWLLLQLPLTVYVWGWQAYGYEEGYSILRVISAFLKKLLLGNTFVASWYLSALIIGMVLTVEMSGFLGNRGLLLIGSACYLLCCLNSCYAGLGILQIRFFYLPNSFPASLLWIAIGKELAENRKPTEWLLKMSRTKRITMLTILCLFYGLEYALCIKSKIAGVTDACLMLVPLCTVLFIPVPESRRKIRSAEKMRTVSTVVYCSHGSLIAVFVLLGNRLETDFEKMPYALLCYCLVVVTGTLLALDLMRIQKKKNLEWIRCFW